MSGPRVVVLADDLIWSTRLAAALTAIGARPTAARTADELEREIVGAEAAVVDLTARAYDPIAAIERAARVGVAVLAVGQHDDQALRKRALAAGAERVHPYRKLFEDGPATLAGWLGHPAPATVRPR